MVWWACDRRRTTVRRRWRVAVVVRQITAAVLNIARISSRTTRVITLRWWPVSARCRSTSVPRPGSTTCRPSPATRPRPRRLQAPPATSASLPPAPPATRGRPRPDYETALTTTTAHRPFPTTTPGSLMWDLDISPWTYTPRTCSPDTPPPGQFHLPFHIM